MTPNNAALSRSSSSLVLPALTAALAALGLVSNVSAQVQVAGDLLVNVDATALPLGALTSITNLGTLAPTSTLLKGSRISLNVANGESYDVAFVADNPGIWTDHCHNLPHAAEGLVVHLMYEGVTTRYVIGGATGNTPE